MTPVRTLPDLKSALSRCRMQNRKGISGILHITGGDSRRPPLVEAISAGYMDALEGIAERELDASISLSLSSLGLSDNYHAAMERVLLLGRAADRERVGLEIDMEERGDAGAAIEAASLCRRAGLPVVLTLQASLYRSAGDLRILLALGIIPRFVKGAYPGDIADPAAIRDRFLGLVREAHRYEIPFRVGTHDRLLLGDIMALMDGRRDLVGFEFLLGLSEVRKDEMAADLWQVSEYIPCGPVRAEHPPPGR